MKKSLIYSMMALFLTTVSCAQGTKKSQDGYTTKTSAMEVSYALGIDVANSLKTFNIEGFDVEEFIRGFRALFADNGKIDIQANQMVIQSFMMELQAQQNEKNKVAAETNRIAGEKNKIEGEEFLAKNKTAPGVITTESGLQYKIEKEGTGEYPTAESTVTAHYKGTLIDGREFDSSYKRGKPIDFPLNGVIKGWTEGIPKVREGGKIKLFIPYNLAYGTQQMQGTIIEPYSALIFEVELIKIVK